MSFYLADDARTTNEFRPLPGEIIHKLLFIYSSSEAMLRCTFSPCAAETSDSPLIHAGFFCLDDCHLSLFAGPEECGRDAPDALIDLRARSSMTAC